MSDVVITDNLLSQYITDSATLSPEELLAVESYLTVQPEEDKLMKSILDMLCDEQNDADFLALSNADFDSEEVEADTVARKMILDIMQEQSEEELFARFEGQCELYRAQEGFALGFDNIDRAAADGKVGNISNK